MRSETRPYLPPALSGYVIAAAVAVVAFVLRWILDRWLGGASPLLLFTLAVMTAAVCGGIGPGLFATALSAAFGVYFLGRDGVPGFTGEATQLVVFALVGAGISVLAERLRNAAQEARLEVAQRRSAEEALREHKELLQTTLTSVGDGMIATDAAGKVTFLNPVAEKLTGWTFADAAGVPLETVFRIVNEDTRAPVENPALRALREGVIVGLANHTVLIAKDGSERPIDDSAAPIRASDGRIRGAVLVFRDISERKRAEAAARAGEERLRLAVAIAAMGTFDIDLVTDEVSVNDEGRRIYGWAEHEPLTFAKVQGHFHPDDKEGVLRRVAEAIDPSGPGEFEVEQRIYRTNGELRWIRVRGRAFFEGEGAERRPVRCLGTYVDITDRKQNEEALRASEAKFRSIFETKIVGMAFWNFDGKVADANDALLEMFHVTREQFVAEGFDWKQRTPEEFRPLDDHALAEMSATGRFAPFEKEFLRNDGSRIPVLLGGGLLPGHTDRGVSFIVDLTARKRAEESVARVTAASERRRRLYETILSNTPDLMYVFDLDHRFTYANDVLLRLWGRTWDEAIGKTCLELGYEPWHAEMHDREIEEVVATKKPIRGEVPFTGTFGRRIYDYIFAPVIGDDGEVEAVAGTTRDVTERKQQEEEIRAREAQFRQLAEAVPQIVWVTRPDGWHEFYNGRWYEYTGMSPEESIGWGWSIPLHPDDKARSEIRWRQATESGEPYEVEYRFRRHDGAYRWFLGRAVPARDETGSVVRWFGTCTDIDDAKRAEQKSAFLADASAHLSELLDYRSTMHRVAQAAVPAFADWITVDLVTSDGTLQPVAATHADRGKERLARELAEKYPPRPDDLHGPARVFRTGEAELVSDVDESIPATWARDDEHLRLLRSLGFRSYLIVPLVSKGRSTGVMTFVTADSGRRYDASDLQVAQDLGRRVAVAVENVGLYEALKEADQRKDEFLAVLAHELRNPLAPIRMGLEVLRLGGDDPDTVNEMLGTMESQVRQMVRLIDDLLDVSRITRGKLDLRKTRVELKDVLKTAVETVRPMIDEARQELTISLPDEPLVLDGDPARLSQVFSNLLNNAAKYTPERGKIALTVERQGSDVVVSVRDTGLGIPEGMLQRVFEMFTQVDRTLERSHGGLGIGLHLVRRLVEMHGGSVAAMSDGEGRGSEFVVRLPLLIAPASSAPSEETSPTGARGRRVLVADDNRDAADMLARVLRVLGHEVRTAYDGEEALVAAESFRPEVCLLDIGMPKVNGFEAASRLREQPWGETMVLVALTGWGAEEDRRRSREAGFDRHLVKPVEPALLREIIAESRPEPA